MRSNRNEQPEQVKKAVSIDDWEMRSNRNRGELDHAERVQYRRLGNAL